VSRARPLRARDWLPRLDVLVRRSLDEGVLPDSRSTRCEEGEEGRSCCRAARTGRGAPRAGCCEILGPHLHISLTRQIDRSLPGEPSVIDRFEPRERAADRGRCPWLLDL
jgi:hypothetical protein